MSATNTHLMFVKHLFALITVVLLLSEVLLIEVSFMMPSKDRTQKDLKKELNKLSRYHETNKDTILMKIYQV